jgi:hypothetical protein
MGGGLSLTAPAEEEEAAKEEAKEEVVALALQKKTQRVLEAALRPLS